MELNFLAKLGANVTLIAMHKHCNELHRQKCDQATRLLIKSGKNNYYCFLCLCIELGILFIQ